MESTIGTGIWHNYTTVRPGEHYMQCVLVPEAVDFGTGRAGDVAVSKMIYKRCLGLQRDAVFQVVQKQEYFYKNGLDPSYDNWMGESQYKMFDLGPNAFEEGTLWRTFVEKWDTCIDTLVQDMNAVSSDVGFYRTALHPNSPRPTVTIHVGPKSKVSDILNCVSKQCRSTVRSNKRSKTGGGDQTSSNGAHGSCEALA